MKAIVHIGAPKTGSSSLQHFLFINAEALASQGFRFHRNVRHRGSQYEYALAAMSRVGDLLAGQDARVRYRARTLEEQAEQVRRFVEELPQYPTRWREHTALFSSEHMLPWLRAASHVKALDEMFREVFSEVRYIVYFRAQPDLILSQYSERIRRGASVPFDQFLKVRLKSAVNHFQPAERWAKTVGRDRLDVRLMDRDFLVNGDLIEDYCRACGIDPAPLSRPGRVNPSLTASAAECLRSLNTYIPEILPDGQANPLRSGLLEDVMRRSTGDAKLRLLPEEKKRIEARTAASNERLRKTYFPDRKTLFTNSDDTETPQARLIARDRALDILAQLYSERRAETPTPTAPRPANTRPILSRLAAIARGSRS